MSNLYLYDDPIYTYDDAGAVYDNVRVFTQTISTRARITQHRTITISGLGRVVNIQTQNILAKANIRVNPSIFVRARILQQKIATISGLGKIVQPITYTRTFTGRSRLSRVQGWPIRDTNDEDYSLWTPTQIYSKARVSTSVAFPTQTVKGKCRVTYGKTLNFRTRARVVPAQRLQARAWILPPVSAATIPVYFSVRNMVTKGISVIFYIGRGASRQNDFTAKARISKISTTRVVGHFIIPMSDPVITDGLFVMSDPVVTSATRQTLMTKVRIAWP